ncbi:MAG: hypothetical protein V2I33_01080, partial [Kangiellaceae bacterium]|nr:hypothetical protein [Kangiellaceae bacterium]
MKISIILSVAALAVTLSSTPAYSKDHHHKAQKVERKAKGSPSRASKRQSSSNSRRSAAQNSKPPRQKPAVRANSSRRPSGSTNPRTHTVAREKPAVIGNPRGNASRRAVTNHDHRANQRQERRAERGINQRVENRHHRREWRQDRQTNIVRQYRHYDGPRQNWHRNRLNNWRNNYRNSNVYRVYHRNGFYYRPYRNHYITLHSHYPVWVYDYYYDYLDVHFHDHYC